MTSKKDFRKNDLELHKGGNGIKMFSFLNVRSS